MAAFPEFGRNRPSHGPEISIPFDRQRRDMVESQLHARGISDLAVLKAMTRVPRHEFLPMSLRHAAYLDSALPLGEGETLSQPYIVALTCEALRVTPGSHVLDVGCGTGYQTAVLLHMGCVVWGVEIDADLAAVARARLDRLGMTGAVITAADGALGWAEHAPFDAIAVAAATEEVPPALLRQLRDGGRLVVPVGAGEDQMLVRITRKGEDYSRENLTPVRFVPLKRKP